MDREQLAKIKVGDRITFKSWTRDHCRKATRVVDGHWWIGDRFTDGFQTPTVRYFGWSGFVVKPHEIIEHIPKGE